MFLSFFHFDFGNIDVLALTTTQWILATIGSTLLVIAVMGLAAPRLLIRGFFRVLLTLLYRGKTVGIENLPSEGGFLVVANHVTWIDGLFILWLLPRNVRFVVDGGNFQNPVLKWAGELFGTIFMSSGPKSIRHAIETTRQGLIDGDVVGLFPEGTLTRTGQLQAFRPGLKKMVQNTNAPIVPIWVDGTWGSIFSFSGGKFFFKWPNKFRRRVTLYIDQPLPADTPVDQVRSRVHSLGAKATIEARREFPILAQRIIRTWRKRGGQLLIADSTGQEVSGREMLIRTLALRRVLRREVFDRDEKYVGVLLPPSVGGVATNVALAMDRRVAVNLNYTVTSDVLNYCNDSVGVRHVLTSQRFIDKLQMDLDAEVVVLESLKDKVTGFDKAIAFVQATLVPARILDRILGTHRIDSDDELTVIFTSGSTGMPKGVMLSVANVSHNVDAIERAVRLSEDDIVLGVLPFFHSFGYAVTLWAVMSLGPRGIYHFNPLDSRQIGKLSEKYKVSVLLATPTFLRGYMRRVTPEQFGTLDVVVVGAEKMPAELFEQFEEKYGVRPVEGYGATELSPLVSVNIPPSRSTNSYQRDRSEGSVGRPLPGVCAKVVSPDTGEELGTDKDGMLMVTGPNVMLGYAGQQDLTRKAVQDGWYNTGDIAKIDHDGFIHITGRLSRFSKIGGEMVPHVRVEEEIAKLIIPAGDPDDAAQDDTDGEGQVSCVVTAVPDSKKGERLIVLHLPMTTPVADVREGLQAAGLPNLFIPSADSFIEVDTIPLLGTGKLDLKAIKDLASEKAGVEVG